MLYWSQLIPKKCASFGVGITDAQVSLRRRAHLCVAQSAKAEAKATLAYGMGENDQRKELCSGYRTFGFTIGKS